MFTTLFVVAAIVGQSPTPHPPIDDSYVAKAGERAMIGNWDVETPANQIKRVFCYSSLERLRQGYDSRLEEPEDEGVSSQPDAYAIRACSAVSVKEIRNLKVVDEDGPANLAVAKVQLLEGEFKGKDLYVSATITS